MFEIGFPELMLIAIVGLLVIGPERLPEALRTLGLWFGRMRRSFTTVKAEIEKEIGMDEVKRQLHNEAILDEMKRIEAEVKNTADSARSSINAGVQAAENSPAAGETKAAGATPAGSADASTNTNSADVAANPAGDDRDHGDAASDDRDHGDAAADDLRTSGSDHRDAGAAGATPIPEKPSGEEVDALDYAIGNVSPPPPPLPVEVAADDTTNQGEHDQAADPNRPNERVTNTNG